MTIESLLPNAIANRESAEHLVNLTTSVRLTVPLHRHGEEVLGNILDIFV